MFVYLALLEDDRLNYYNTFLVNCLNNINEHLLIIVIVKNYYLDQDTIHDPYSYEDILSKHELIPYWDKINHKVIAKWTTK